MWMNWKSNVELIVNEDMRYLLMDANYNPHAWDNLVNALMNSKICDVENSSNGDLIAFLKKHIKDIEFDDLMPLYDAVTDNERFGRNMMSEQEMIEFLNGDDDA